MSLDFLRPYFVKRKIRAGRDRDGGYVLEKDSLKEVDVVYSYGVGWEISFEKAIFNITRKTCRLFDPTMLDVSTFQASSKKGPYQFVKYCAKAVLWTPFILLQKLKGYQIHFYNEGLDTARREKYDSFSGHIKRFGDENKKIFLKIDIEGGEYSVFNDPGFISALDNVVQLVIEFHELETRLSDLKKIIESIEPKLALVHLHGNNWSRTFQRNGKTIPNAIELTFVNNKFFHEKRFDETNYPIPGIDFPNKTSEPDIELSQFTNKF